jgi:AbrB family looped-hinge helix DNA binding protein
MTYKVGPKGQVVLPKKLRDRLGIQPGDEVMVDEGDDGDIRIRKVRPVEELLGMFADYPGSLTEALMEAKREERELERRKEERWNERFFSR